jgi:ABC-type amino acid transport substrate-binding protein
MSLATSGNEEYSRSILSDIYSQESVDQFSSLNILTVPKDIDALMAVGFGLADAALTTKSSLDKLSTLYQQQNQALHIIGESHSLKRLAVVFKQIPQAEHRQIQFILRQMAKDKKGKRGLSMLGLDDWRLVDEHLTTNKGSGR